MNHADKDPSTFVAQQKASVALLVRQQGKMEPYPLPQHNLGVIPRPSRHACRPRMYYHEHLQIQ